MNEIANDEFWWDAERGASGGRRNRSGAEGGDDFAGAAGRIHRLDPAGHRRVGTARFVRPHQSGQSHAAGHSQSDEARQAQ